jgi:CRISPR-associated protein Csd1
MAGYRADLGPAESVIIMAIDSATPGRMGIILYRDFLADEYIKRVARWHSEFAWLQRFSKEIRQPDGKSKREVVWTISAPAPQAILTAVYGDIEKGNEALKKNFFERLMPCIVDGSPFPIDMLESSIRRASNPSACEPWEWQQTLGVVCALYRGYYTRQPIQKNRRDYSMALELTNTSRDYLYGRLLAVAERIEEIALKVAGENRTTTAMRLMQRFADRPYGTWRNMELALQPYMQRLQTSRTGFLVNSKKELDEILSAFEPASFTSDKALSGEFLLGYHCQRQAFQIKTEAEIETNVD